MTRPSTDHVTIVARDGHLLQCLHCGTGHQPTLPMPAAQFETVLRGFSLMHRLCPKPEAPSRQMALPGTEREIPIICQRCGGGVKAGDATDHYRTCLGPNDERFSAIELKAGDADPLDTTSDGRIIDASTDEPAPEIDPPGPEPWALKYPMARDHGDLRGQLAVALGNSGMNTPPLEQLQQWHVATGIFDAIAHWARIQIALLNETEDRKHNPDWKGPGYRPPMPDKLRELIEGKAPKKKRSRK